MAEYAILMLQGLAVLCLGLVSLAEFPEKRKTMEFWFSVFIGASIAAFVAIVLVVDTKWSFLNLSQDGYVAVVVVAFLIPSLLTYFFLWRKRKKQGDKALEAIGKGRKYFYTLVANGVILVTYFAMGAYVLAKNSS